MPEKKKHWKVLESKEILKKGFFRLRADKVALPDGRVMPAYYTFELADWVNILPITRDHKVVLVKQYRHSVGQVCYELPGGTCSHGGRLENPQKAGLRELAEETGYTCGEIRLLGKCFPNPALQSNQVWNYVALDCEKTGEPQLDPYEDIEVVLVSFAELFDMIRTGKFNHSLMVQAVHLALPFLGFHIP